MFVRRVLQRDSYQYTIAHRLPAVRAYSTTTCTLPNGIKLAYDLHEPPNPKEGSQHNAPPIIFMHGLFGSKKNNRSMSKYAPITPTNTHQTPLLHI